MVTTIDLDSVLNVGSKLDRLRTACMIADVLDYGGRYGKAKEIIQNHGAEAERRLSTMDPADLTDPIYIKQECWALLMWGMCSYRTAGDEFADALKRFHLARKVLEILTRNGIPCVGTLSRTWYCIGLVYRQKKDYSEAKASFVRSLELGGIGVKARKDTKSSTASFDYNMARCLGLGLGWIAYDEALLDDAKGSLVMARRALIGNKVTFIRAYIEVIHACVLLSAHSDDLARIDEAIGILRGAYEVLMPKTGPEHPPYALRAAVELALAYLRRSRVVPACDDDNDLREAERILKSVTVLTAVNPDRRTYCAALVAESRVNRERGQKQDALEAAKKAAKLSSGMKFSHIDALICLGEAWYELGEYEKAADSFNDALDLGRSSRKIVAVCHLHLTRTCIRCQQPAKALEHFTEWKTIEPGLQNSFITALADRIFREGIQSTQEFHIQGDVVDLNAKRHVARLHNWLILKALSRTNDDWGRAAVLLDTTTPTMRNWKKGNAEPESSAMAASI